MIPNTYIQAWSAKAPWPDARQIEQDLIISRALCDLFGVRFNDDDAIQAFERVWMELIIRIKGDAWKLTDKALEELRAQKYPGLLRR